MNDLPIVIQAHTLAPSVYRRTVRQNGVGHVALDGKVVRWSASTVHKD